MVQNLRQGAFVQRQLRYLKRRLLRAKLGRESVVASASVLILVVSILIVVFVPGRGGSPALISPTPVSPSNLAPSNSKGGMSELVEAPSGSEPGRSNSSSDQTERRTVPGHELNPRTTGIATSSAPEPVPTATSIPQQHLVEPVPGGPIPTPVPEPIPTPVPEPIPTEEEPAPIATPEQPPVKSIPEPEPNN